MIVSKIENSLECGQFVIKHRLNCLLVNEPYRLPPRKIFQNNYLEVTSKEYFFCQLVDSLVILYHCIATRNSSANSNTMLKKIDFSWQGQLPLCPPPPPTPTMYSPVIKTEDRAILCIPRIQTCTFSLH